MSKKVLFIYTPPPQSCLSACSMACQFPYFTFSRPNLHTVLFAQRPFLLLFVYIVSSAMLFNESDSEM